MLIPLAADPGLFTCQLFQHRTPDFQWLEQPATRLAALGFALALGGWEFLLARRGSSRRTAAVIKHHLGHTLAEVEDVPAHHPLPERLKAVGLSIIEESLEPEAVALLRVIVAEAPRFPELDLGAERIGWQRGVQRVAEAIAARDRASASMVERAMPAAAKFIDLVLVPYQMRALLGEAPDTLRAVAPLQIEEAITMLTATGWFDEWA